MSGEITVRQVANLNGANFLTWKFQMRAVFRASRVRDIVDGTRTAPAAGAAADLVEQWDTDNARAMVLISQTVEPDQLESLITCETAKEMWDTLCQVHEQKSSGNKLFLMQKFYDYKMASSDSVVQHVAKVKNMAAQLRDVGEAMSNHTVMAKILATLAPKFSAFQTVWDNVEEGRQTIENLTERLIREEARFANSGEATEALAVVKTGGRKNKPQSSGTSKNRISKKDAECYKCREKGHFARDCPKKNKKRGDRDGSESAECAFVISKDEVETEKGPPKQNADFSNEQVRQLLEVGNDDVWLTDSGASRHVSFRREWFDEFKPREGDTVVLGNGRECAVVGEGTIRVEKFVGGKWSTGRIEGVLYVPSLKKNLFSVGMCTEKGYDVQFSANKVTIRLKNEEKAVGVRQNNATYRMFFRVILPRVSGEVNAAIVDLKVWHERLGHVGSKALTDMVKNNLVTGVQIKNADKFFCEPCQLGKAHVLPFKNKRESRNTKPGEFVHTDVSGKIQVDSIGRSSYYVTFIDDASSFCYVYFIQQKDEVVEKFALYEKIVANKFGTAIKVVRSDNGGEYKNAKLEEYLGKRGIIMENTAPYTPQQNGKAERANRTIIECVRAMLTAKGLPKNLWAEAVSTAVYILNRTTHSSRKDVKTPYEIWTGNKPDLSHVRIFGSVAYKHVPKQLRRKLDDKSKKMVLVGYQGNSANYRLYDPLTQKVSVSRDVVFDEKLSEVSNSESDSKQRALVLPKFTPVLGRVNENRDDEVIEILDEEEEFGDAEDAENAAVPHPREEQRNERQNPAAEQRQLRDRQTLRTPRRFDIDFVEYETPQTFREATQGPDKKKWISAIKNELHAHDKNKTWTVVEREKGMKLIDSKWVFKQIQDKTEGGPRYKARLCARGFLQQPGLDYKETFAPVVRYDSLRMFLARVTQMDYELIQFDVCTAFLYGELEEEILMKIPEGLVVEEEGNREESESESSVCRLNKSLYGLKQAPRCWNQKFNAFLKKFNLVQSEADQCIYTGQVEGCEVFLALFVDDGLVASKSSSVLEKMIVRMKGEFEITLGDASKFVGVQIERNRDNKTMFIHQSEYVNRILSKFRMAEAKPLSVPADPHTILGPAEPDCEKQNVPYREAVGSLLFLSIVSRPDIAFAVNSVSKFLNNHDPSHWRSVKRIFSYLIGTKDLGIMYRSDGDGANLTGFCDADYAGDLETRRSTTGYAFSFANGLVTWSSQRQKLVTLSTTEAEYVAAAAAAREIVWLRKLLRDLGVDCEQGTVLHVDNQSAIRLTKNPVMHQRTKHIDVRHHFIREKIESKEISVVFVPTDTQKADLFTKAMPRARFWKLIEMLNLKNYREYSNSESIE